MGNNDIPFTYLFIVYAFLIIILSIVFGILLILYTRKPPMLENKMPVQILLRDLTFVGYGVLLTLFMNVLVYPICFKNRTDLVTPFITLLRY